MEILNKRCCDLYDNCTNKQTLREWIHDTYKYIYRDENISDEGLNKMSDEEIKDFVEELDWLANK